MAAKGTQLAGGIVLLWLGGACLFVAFESGKIPAFAKGPTDAGSLASGLAAAVQSQEKPGKTGG